MIERPFTPVPKPEPRKKGGKGPRRSGDRVERLVAESVGGQKQIGSGAFKAAGLTGDVTVKDNEGKGFLKLEVKASGAVSAAGEKSYTIKRSELDQMKREAEEVGELGALVFHFKGQNIEDANVIMSMRHFKEIVELAKLGRSMQK